MYLTEIAIEKIKSSPSAKRELVYQLETTYTTMYKWLSDNSKDGKLTTATAVSIIKQETGLKQAEILTK